MALSQVSGSQPMALTQVSGFQPPQPMALTQVSGFQPPQPMALTQVSGFQPPQPMALTQVSGLQPPRLLLSHSPAYIVLMWSCMVHYSDLLSLEHGAILSRLACAWPMASIHYIGDGRPNKYTRSAHSQHTNMYVFMICCK